MRDESELEEKLRAQPIGDVGPDPTSCQINATTSYFKMGSTGRELALP